MGVIFSSKLPIQLWFITGNKNNKNLPVPEQSSSSTNFCKLIAVPGVFSSHVIDEAALKEEKKEGKKKEKNQHTKNKNTKNPIFKTN